MPLSFRGSIPLTAPKESVPEIQQPGQKGAEVWPFPEARERQTNGVLRGHANRRHSRPTEGPTPIAGETRDGDPKVFGARSVIGRRSAVGTFESRRRTGASGAKGCPRERRSPKSCRRDGPSLHAILGSPDDSLFGFSKLGARVSSNSPSRRDEVVATYKFITETQDQ